MSKIKNVYLWPIITVQDYLIHNNYNIYKKKEEIKACDL